VASNETAPATAAPQAAPPATTTTKKAAKKPANKPAKKPGKKPAKRAVKKAARKAAGKSNGRTNDKPAAKVGDGPVAAVAPAVAPAAAEPARVAAPASKPATVPRRQRPTKRAERASRRRANSAQWVIRVFAEPNTDGPRARVGLVWFALLVPAAYFGATPIAVLFGLIAGIAALQAGQAWRRAGYRPSRLVAAPFAMALPAVAVTSYSLPGAVVVALPVVALIAAFLVPRRRRRTTAVGAAGLTVLCALVPGLAATGMAYTARLGVGACIVFVVLISAYDVGSFLVGAEASSPSHGIIAGCLCSLVAMGPVFAFQLPPFDGETAAWVFGGMIAVFAPLGQILASLALPTGSTWVPALRRLDAYVLTAPLWAWSLWSYLG
jgi:hypothetical protein